MNYLTKLPVLSLVTGLSSLVVGCGYPKVIDLSANTTDVPTGDTVIREDIPTVDDRPNADDVIEVDQVTVDQVTVDQVTVDQPMVVADTCVPNGVEVCDGRDNDCDGRVDNVPAANLQDNMMHCGMCGRACTGGTSCSAGVCTEFPTTGMEGDYVAPAGMTVTLSPGRHDFRSFTVNAGATVTLPPVNGTGTLEIRVVGNVVINGTIDLRGGNGGNSLPLAGVMGVMICNNPTPESQGGGLGGIAATPINGQRFGGCFAAAGGARPMDMSGAGANGTRNGAQGSCGGLGGINGGGAAGGRRGSGGGGGGGPAGGGGGSGVARNDMGLVGSGNGGAGGATGMNMAAAGGGIMCAAPPGLCTALGGAGGIAPMGFAGLPGGTGTGVLDGIMYSRAGGGGGGGSIGAEAAMDLSIRGLTPGGSGGGGGGGGDPCFQYGNSFGLGGGGGGGGGALRIVAGGTITIGDGASIRVNGGNGGSGSADLASGGGGGGAGGAIDLRAPSIAIVGTANIDARGGTGGTAGLNGGAGGNGGVGRIRLALNADAMSCNIAAGAFRHNFANMANPCEATAGPGAANTVFVTRFPR